MIQSAMAKDGRRLTGYNTSHNNSYSNNNQIQHHHHHSLYDDDLDEQHNHYYDDEDDEDDHGGHDEDEDEDDSASVLSIPDPNINFDLVYALHTFAATVDGQASVVKGDALTLLDDSNSYWWLVKVLKTSEVGYIPAENIETPYERLARLNSHRNIELTRRDIQDAFPVPPSAKAKVTKRVTLAKGVKFQAQVIFGGSSSDEEDEFAEEYEEWDETLISSESDDMSSESDDYDYYSSHLSGNTHTRPPITNSNSSNHQQQIDSIQNTTTESPGEYNIHPQSIVSTNNKAAHVPPIVTQSLDRRPSEQHDSPDLSLNNDSTIPGPRNIMDLEQSDTVKISMTPPIANGSDTDNNYTAPRYVQSQQQLYNHHHQQQHYQHPYQHQEQQQQKKSTTKLDKILGDDESLSSPTSPRSMNGSKKSAIRKFFSRGSKDNGTNGKRKDSKTSSLGGDSILSESASLSSQSTTYSERDRSGSLDSAMLLQTHGTPSISDNNSRYHTPMDGPNSVMASPTSPSSLMSPSSFTSNSSPLDQYHTPPNPHPHPHHSHHHHHQQHQNSEQPTTLTIHSGDLALGGNSTSASVFTSTTAMEVIQQVVASLDHEHAESLEDRAMNYYLVVKGVDGDEYTLVPSDRPLSIYHSLTGYLNTPMPSLKKARRISQLMSTGSDATTHIGGPSHHHHYPASPTSPTGLESSRTTVSFYIHSKRRTINDGGTIRIKVSLLQSEIVDQDGLFGPGQTRVDKSLSVSHTDSIGEVAALILERFHLLNGVVDGSSDLNDQIKALRLEDSSQGRAVLYRLNVFRNGQEFVLNVNDPITKAYDGAIMPPIHYSRNSNPDRSSTTSMSSIIHSPQADETFFILRCVQHVQVSSQPSPMEQTSQPPQRPVRSHRPPIRQNTPMPLTKTLNSTNPAPTIHPLEIRNYEYNDPRSMSPVDITSPIPLQGTASYVNQHSHHHTPPSHQKEYTDSTKEQMTPEEDGDVLLKLNEALDSLAHTRNSNEPLTDAITHHQQLALKNATTNESPINRNNQPSHINYREQPSPSSISPSSTELPPFRSEIIEDPPSTTSTTSTMATSTLSTINDYSNSTKATDNSYNKDKSTRNRHGSIQSMLYWEDFGMDEMMTLIRGAAKCQEAMERKEVEKKNRRSSRHYTASIRNEISEVFKDSHAQLEQLEKELDMLMAQAVKTYCR